MKRGSILIGFCLIFIIQADAQNWLNKLGNTAKEAAKNTIERRVEQKAEEVTTKAMDKAEDSMTKSDENNTSQSSTEKSATTGDDEEGTVNSNPQKLVSRSRYDFVPGDQIIYFDDFSQDATGDFPALWTSNGSGEIRTVNIAPGNWFHMNGENAVYCYMKELDLPDNFIVEFDIILDEDDRGTQFTLYNDEVEHQKELNSDLFPGVAGLHIAMEYDLWESRGYKDGEDWIDGHASRNPVVREKVNHVIIWIQKRRVRIYHQNEKVLDMPTNIYPGVKFNRMRFSGWDRYSEPYISNLKITTTEPDTRDKLVNDGLLITYGITFDVNKADVKPESFATLKSIADVLEENGSVKVTIIGHTDSDGDDMKNLELSQRRAESIKSVLVKTFGIDASRLETEGAGETKPIASNDTPENKARNRRVEFVKTN